MHNIYYLGLSGEHRCPLGYLLWYSEMISLLTINVRGGGGGGDQISIAYCLFSFV